MQNYLKFLAKLPKNLRLKVISVIGKIADNNLKNLDIKSLSLHYNLYRCRTGKIRIIFQKREGENYILDVGFRGGIYKKLDN